MTHYGGAAKDLSRAANLMKKRQKELEEIEFKKKKLEEELNVGSIKNKFASHFDAIEQQLKTDTIGLVTLDQMKAKQEEVVQEREKQLALKESEAKLRMEKEEKATRKRKSKKAVLSFTMDEEEDGDAEEETTPKEKVRKEEGEELETSPSESKNVSKKKHFGKNPHVDTSFLPDREREAEEAQLRISLQREWRTRQETIKNEDIEIVYSFWDGKGHRKQMTMKKGHTIGQFLNRCLESLRKDFADLKYATVDMLMYIKEDLIIPHHNTFYDFIVTKARGKSGPLFQFDAREDVRIINDASIAKDESHAGKVMLRTWYERHKHIYPASRWEPYDPEKKWD